MQVTEEVESDDYGIERLPNGEVQIRLGAVMPFEIPPEAAIRMAALLCKKAGCDVMFRQGSMKIKFPRGFEFGKAESTIEEKVN